MQKSFEIFLNQGVTGAVAVIAIMVSYVLFKKMMGSYEERLKEKDLMINKLLDSELRTAHIIELFKEVKPIFDETRELLKRIYTKSAGL
jgi:hypothetical protein